MGVSRAAVWAVLADFPNIADWNSGVKASLSTSEAAGGVGASRHCDLAPVGKLEETVEAWEPDNRMAVRIDSAARLPLKSGLVTFTLEETEVGSTDVSIVYAYEPRFGPLARLMGPFVDRQLKAGFTGFLDDLEAAASLESV
jgi:hypothetical protein